MSYPSITFIELLNLYLADHAEFINCLRTGHRPTNQCKYQYVREYYNKSQYVLVIDPLTEIIVHIIDLEHPDKLNITESSSGVKIGDPAANLLIYTVLGPDMYCDSILFPGYELTLDNSQKFIHRLYGSYFLANGLYGDLNGSSDKYEQVVNIVHGTSTIVHHFDESGTIIECFDNSIGQVVTAQFDSVAASLDFMRVNDDMTMDNESIKPAN